MRWYDGGIAEAVATSKTQNAIFVVYVEGKDEKSKNLTSLINGQDISSKLESTDFVALKLEAGTIPHNQFNEIYKNVTVPSVFFIGKTGQPIDIIIDVANNEELSNRIDKIIQAHKGGIPSIQSRSASTQSEMLINREQQTSHPPTDTPITEDILENGMSTTQESDVDVEEIETNPDVSKEDKIQRAKDLVEKKRETKKQEDEETQRQKELERRKMGQDVQKLRRWQQDQELKDMMEERKREKNEEKAARDRILAQIAQDRADRAVRFGTTVPSISPTTTEPSKPAQNTVQSNTAKLQFRLPNGNTNTNNFDSLATLQEVRTYIINNIQLPFRNFVLSTTFPRREFTEEDNVETLQDLKLCPNAIILILPAPASVTLNNQGGSLSTLIWMLFSPIFNIFGYFRNLIFGVPPPAPDTSSQPERNKRNAGAAAEANEQQSNIKRRMTDTGAVRRQGNIHRFTDRSDSDEDNNTWNGNSTQQM